MENASKALIMAGAILIAILIISLGVMIFNNMSGTVRREANLDKQTIASFNAKITPYIGNNVPGSQVNALIELGRAINQKAKDDSDTIKCVSITGIDDNHVYLAKDNTAVEKVLTGVFYVVQGKYDNNGLITEIKISKVQEVS